MFNFYAAQIIDGIAYGSVYGIFAMSIVLIYRANKLFNMAQTEIATFCVIVMAIAMKKWGVVPAFLFTIVFSFILGCALHFTVMRFVTERKKVLTANVSVITIALFTIFNSLSSYVLGGDPEAFPSPFGSEASTFFGVVVSHQSMGILATTCAIVLIMVCVFKFTKLGLVFEAVAENLTAAKHRGIRASNVLAVAWGLTALTSTLGGMLIAPILYVTPSMLLGIWAYSLISIVIGGLESPLGALVGGIMVGIVENLSSNISFIGAELKFTSVVVLLLLVLVFRPRGLWGRKEARRV